jgi:hypothetical protein
LTITPEIVLAWLETVSKSINVPLISPKNNSLTSTPDSRVVMTLSTLAEAPDSWPTTI